MLQFSISGCSYGNGTGGPHLIHKVRYLPDIPLIVRPPRRAPMDLVLRLGSSTPIPRTPNGSTEIASFCRTGE